MRTTRVGVHLATPPLVARERAPAASRARPDDGVDGAINHDRTVLAVLSQLQGSVLLIQRSQIITRTGTTRAPRRRRSVPRRAFNNLGTTPASGPSSEQSGGPNMECVFPARLAIAQTRSREAAQHVLRSVVSIHTPGPGSRPCRKPRRRPGRRARQHSRILQPQALPLLIARGARRASAPRLSSVLRGTARTRSMIYRGSPARRERRCG